MKSIIHHGFSRHWLGVGMSLLLGVSVSQAQWYLAGDFQGWVNNSTPMTAGPNAGEFSYTITGGTAGAYGNAKVTDGTWNNTWPSQNLKFLYDTTGSATIHFWPGTTIDGWTPIANRVGYDDPNNDLGWGMAGDLNGYDGTQALLLSIGNGVYSNNIVFPTAGSGGFKFQSPAGSWNNIYFGSDFGNNGNNGNYTTTTTPQTLPVVLDLPNGRYVICTPVPVPPPTNYITFQLDLSAEVALGTFTNTDTNPSDPNFGLPVNSVAIAGDFIGWGTGAQLTNATILNPADTRTNVYIGTFQFVAFLPNAINVKFRVNNLDGGYENPVSTGGNNRLIAITNANQVLSVIKYDDKSVYDLVLHDTWVTFSLYLPDQTALDPSPGVFTKGSDIHYVNGAWLGWPAWGVGNLPSDQALTEVGTSDVYTNSLLVPKGSSIYITYKYSVDGVDNENGSGINHIREIRTYATNYAFPQDVWSWSLPGNGALSTTPGLTSTNIVEPDFGYLVITGTPHVPVLPITWLGRPGVVLQNVSSLNGGSWNSNAGTDGTQSTNWPNTGSSQFFRLMKKQ